jgi:hypothetical protein
MTPYEPLYIRAPEQGLIQSRQNFILPDDAYPILENAFVWREQIRRRSGLSLLGRLQLSFSVNGNSLTSGSINLVTALSLPSNAQIVPGTINIVGGSDGTTYTDPALDGVLVATGGTGVGGSINYSTGLLTITAGANQPITGTFFAYPMLPVMGIRTQEVNLVDNEPTIVFDTKYAYIFNGITYQQLASSTPTTWTGANYNFFWSTNYWTDGNTPPNKLMWVTNFSSNDPIRYYNNVTWTNFSPTVDGSLFLQSCLALLPFRGRLLAFNTVEGAVQYVPTNGTSYPQRIRWSAIGSPLTTNSWNDTIRGQGGFLDIPTSEDITAVGFVRDNLVVYCERSTWQLRYTGRSISPFQIERVNSELGSYSLFSAVQFDESLTGIGDKGVVDCNTNAARRIDVKIPDLVFEFSGNNQAPQRVCGIRDIQQRVVFWSYVDNTVANQAIGQNSTSVYPNRRLVYNYENESWAIFTDSLTALGVYQNQTGLTWAQATRTWEDAAEPWADRPILFPNLIGGNQQGFVMELDSNLNAVVTNDSTLAITAISSGQLTIPSHNLVNDQVIQISGMSSADPFFALNGVIGGVRLVNQNVITINLYNPAANNFTGINPVPLTGTYLGSGVIATRDGFNIVSKKFNYQDQGQNIQIGFIDLLMTATSSGQITMNMYLNYDDSTSSNSSPDNTSAVTGLPDPFFNTIINTYQSQLSGQSGSKYLQRVYCSTRAAFLTIQYTLSNAQLVSEVQSEDVQIDSQIIWKRPAGRLQSF